MSDSLQPHGLQPTRLLCPLGFTRQEYWSGLPCPSPGDLPNPGIELRSLKLQVDSLPSELPGKPLPQLQKKKKKKRKNKLCLGINKSVISLEFEKKKKNETCQTPLSFIIAWSLLKFLSIESVMLFNHLILFHPLLLLSSVFPSIRVFSNESAL